MPDRLQYSKYAKISRSQSTSGLQGHKHLTVLKIKEAVKNNLQDVPSKFIEC